MVRLRDGQARCAAYRRDGQDASEKTCRTRLKAKVTDHLWTMEELSDLIEQNRRNRENSSN
jgi:hypothetical protein